MTHPHTQEQRSAGLRSRRWGLAGALALAGLLSGVATATATAAAASCAEEASDAVRAQAPRLQACFAPGTSHEVIAERMRHVTRFGTSLSPPPGTPGYTFDDNDRWWSTATDGGGLGQGNPTTLTWSVVPDGTKLPYGAEGVGEPEADSDLRARLDFIYPGGQAEWQPIFASVFDRWGELTGITYVYEAADDGAELATAAGALGVRGDIRIGGHYIDGDFDTLAYNFYPDDGDMVIDTADDYFLDTSNDSRPLRNTLSHEHGHGLGIDHVCPLNETKLMEPSLSEQFDGPQHDDTLAGNRGYGDTFEHNDTSGTASSRGAFGDGTSETLEGLSIDDNGDADFFSVDVTTAFLLSASIDPVGSTYKSGEQNMNGSCSPGNDFNSLAIHNLGLEVRDIDGTTVLATANANPAGQGEELVDVSLPSGAGTYFVRVFGDTSNAAQLYDLTISTREPPFPSISIDDVSMNEGDVGTTDFVFTVTLSESPIAEVMVDYDTADGSATAGSDYTALSDTLTFAVGQSAKMITVSVDGDLTLEGAETFTVDLSNPTNATLADPQGVGTILDDDGVVPETLDSLYDDGGAGSGRTVTADSGPLELLDGAGTLLQLDNGDAGGAACVLTGGTLLVQRTDGAVANIRFNSEGPGQQQTWTFQNNPGTSVFAIRDATAGNSPVRVFAGSGSSTLVLRDGAVGVGTAAPRGALDVNGAIYQRGSRLHADYVFERGRESLPSIAEHTTEMWSRRHLPAVPGRQIDEAGREVLDAGAHRRGMLEELEIAHVYIAELDQRVRVTAADIGEVRTRLDRERADLAVVRAVVGGMARGPSLPLVRVESLDDAYDAGGAGLGRSIMVDQGPVAVTGGTTLLELDNGNTGGTVLELTGGTLLVQRTDGSVANIQFTSTGGVSGDQAWAFQNNPSNSVFAIRDATTGNSPVKIYAGGESSTLVVRDGRVGIGTATPQGTLDVNGTMLQRGAFLHADHVFDPDYHLESIDEHAAEMWRVRHLPAVPAREIDTAGREVVRVGAHRRGMLEELEKAHIYIAELDRRAEAREGQVSAAQMRSGERRRRLHALAERALGVETTTSSLAGGAAIARISTLDVAYDGVGAGAGRSIDADQGPVVISGGEGTLLRVDNGDTAGDVMEVTGGTLVVQRTDGKVANIIFRSSGGSGTQTWAFQNNPATGVFAIRDATAGDSPVRVFAGGSRDTLVVRGGRVGIGVADPLATLDVEGEIYQRGVQLHADYVFDDDYPLESIVEHADRMWRERHLPRVAPRTVDADGFEVLEVGSHRRGMLEELEIAHIYIERVHLRLQDQGRELGRLRDQEVTLERELAAVERVLQAVQGAAPGVKPSGV